MLWPPALRGVFSLNPKITKLLAEREKNSEKIAKLNARNDEIDKQVTELENLDIAHGRDAGRAGRAHAGGPSVRAAVCRPCGKGGGKL